MSGLVSGYSGIIAPPNLITNGSFSIKQRGNTGGLFQPVTVGSYVADCWKIVHTTADYLSYQTLHNQEGASGTQLGSVAFKGYGKKGQQVIIMNKESDYPLGFMGSTAGEMPKGYMTSSVMAYVYPSSVDLSIESVPTFNYGNAYTAQIISNSIAKKGQFNQFVQVVESYYDRAGGGNHPPHFVFTLQQDGEFLVRFGAFSLFAGAFKNPPKYAPVPYADDLARCQRYYQKGHINLLSRFARYTATNSVIRIPVRLNLMASAPTAIVTDAGCSYYNSNGTNPGFTPSIGIPSVGPEQLTISVGKDDVVIGPALADSGAEVALNWTAEVV